MSATETMIEHKNEKFEQPNLDALSHALRTPLHAISHHIQLLESSSPRLEQIRAKLQVTESKAWQQKLEETAVFLEKKVNCLETNLAGLESFIVSGGYETLFQAFEKRKELAIPSPLQFIAHQEELVRGYAALLVLQKEIRALSTTEGVGQETLESRLKEIAAGLKTHLTGMTASLSSLAPAGWRHTIGESYHVEVAGTSEKVLKALVVDDTAINRKILGKILEKEGFTCDYAEDGAKAVEKYAPEKYDIIFMDITMPVMDGYDATRTIRQQERAMSCNRAPIIAVTAIAPTGENAANITAAGMDSFISKPFTAAHLKGLIKQYALKQPASPVSSDIDDSGHPLPPPLELKSVPQAALSSTLLAGRSTMTLTSAPTSEAPASRMGEVAASKEDAPLTAADLMRTLGFMGRRASLADMSTLPSPAVTLHLNSTTSVF